MNGLHFPDGPLSSRILRMVGSIALLFLYVHQYANQGITSFVGCALILLVYLGLIWTPETWWNGAKFIFISSLVIAVTLILHYTYGTTDSSLLWPLVGILATVYGKYRRLSIILASFTIGVTLLISYTYAFPIGTLLGLVGMFVGIRSSRVRRDAYRMSQLHLQELNEAHRELQQAHAELQEATVHSMRYAALEERTRLAREIHDGLGHQLTSLIVQLQALEIMLPNDPGAASSAVKQLLDISRRAMAEVRMAVREWSNDEMGLGLVALKGLVTQTQGRSSIHFTFVQDSEVSELPLETSVVLYRVLQESLTNILRHSKATSVTVRIQEVDDQVDLSVSDDGHYADETPLTPGFGLKGVMERCRLHGGSCTLAPEKPHGLRIQAVLPIVSEAKTRQCSRGRITNSDWRVNSG